MNLIHRLPERKKLAGGTLTGPKLSPTNKQTTLLLHNVSQVLRWLLVTDSISSRGAVKLNPRNAKL